MKSLVDVPDMFEIPGLQIPDQLYQVLRDPAPLAGMKHPSVSTPWDEMYQAGLKYVVCLTCAHPTYDPSPVTLLRAVTLRNLDNRDRPPDPDSEARLISEVTTAVTERLLDGSGVVVHCVGGRGRTGTVLGCVLRELRYSAKEIIEYLDTLHRARTRPGWPESSWQAEVVEQYVPSSALR